MRTILYVDDHADTLERGKALLATDRRRVIGAGAGRDVETRAIPVVVASAEDILDTPALQTGLVAAYVRKPGDPGVFLSLVERILAGLSRGAAVRPTGGGVVSDLFWRCIACDADWFRPTGDPLHQETQCMRCDGLLVLMEA